MAVDERNRAIEEEGEIDEFWCVFDVEWPRNHPGLSEAIQQAGANDIKLAVSNPCFELWLILHFQNHSAWLDNYEARRLRRQLDGSKDKSLIPSNYMSSIKIAMHRAAELDKRHVRDGTVFPHDNPSSGMYRLIASIEPVGR